MKNRLSDFEVNDEFAQRIIGLAMTVHSALGCGHLESLYVDALLIELDDAGLVYEREKKYPVSYKGRQIGYFFADILIENRLIVEVKAVESLAVAHSVQIVNYLACSGIESGLLLNFGPRRLEFKTKSRNYRPVPPNLQA